MDASNQPLIDPGIAQSKAQTMIQFYDEICTIGISADIAFGYLILLGGPPESHETPNLSLSEYKKLRALDAAETIRPTPCQDEDDATVKTQISSGISGDPQLAFAAITDGNVIDACTGGAAIAKRTKDFLRESAEDDPRYPALAIRAYRRCFLVIRGYYAALESCALGPCCHERKIRRVAFNELSKAFVPLIELVQRNATETSVKYFNPKFSVYPAAVEANYSSFPEKVETSIST
mmetsp:Transcript_20325/g.40564  ORF Transcript_20325/g.40564 Transcript_20325/m.40564 type:complete len:235 (-) Transcript_20325:194-898(-)|eukprot:CAMPEP_0194334764 /NCGR_PEP_ID=MMETSP0171-20130528/67225_1 /TAXON_ID=218684 /ORGANISM="Corethron pennatum, Strain L29A3" /LENGTH=234 /DNA_ID=CAMNT_0039097559 /DNA_START=432 /DNA_END=1136 /DNA_ORIENTATION=-